MNTEISKNINSNETQEQLMYINAPIKSNIILQATAGSGKSASTIRRVNYLLEQGVLPEKIIVFSYTKAAVQEFESRLQNPNVKITTIHAFCQGMLARMKKAKAIADTIQFIEWYKKKYAPSPTSSTEVKATFHKKIDEMYEDSQYIGSEIAAFKLQTADNIRCKYPDYYKDYRDFQRETKSRDFSDMLIEVHDLLKEDKWLSLFKNKYDYIFVDEAQDMSTIQCRILLALNSKHYTFILDENQSIYGYSGSNVRCVLELLRNRRKCVEYSLSKNFRSKKIIVEHSNGYSSLHAVPHSQEDGDVNKYLIYIDDVINLFKTKPQVAVLVRTNSAIKNIERRLLMKKVPIRYFNYITPKDIENIKKAEINKFLQRKISKLIGVYGSLDNLISFIEHNKNSPHHVTSIHKSKGLQYDTVVVVNIFSPEIIELNDMASSIEPKVLKDFTFDPDDEEDYESKNVFYVAITRPCNSLYFSIIQ